MIGVVTTDGTDDDDINTLLNVFTSVSQYCLLRPFYRESPFGSHRKNSQTLDSVARFGACRRDACRLGVMRVGVIRVGVTCVGLA